MLINANHINITLDCQVVNTNSCPVAPDNQSWVESDNSFTNASCPPGQQPPSLSTLQHCCIHVASLTVKWHRGTCRFEVNQNWFWSSCASVQGNKISYPRCPALHGNHFANLSVELWGHLINVDQCKSLINIVLENQHTLDIWRWSPTLRGSVNMDNRFPIDYRIHTVG